MHRTGATVLWILVLVVTPAKAVCLLGIGNTCPIEDSAAARILRPLVNGKLVGSFALRHTILFDTLRLGPSAARGGNNERRLRKVQAVLFYINGGGNCHDVETIWGTESSFHGSKEDFCDLSQVLGAHSVCVLRAAIGPLRPAKEGLTKEIFLRFELTESGEARAEKSILGRGAETITVATGSLNFLRVVRNDGASPVTAVDFQYEVVPNVWAHVQKGLRKTTLSPERKIGRAVFRDDGDQWQLIEGPRF